MARLGYLDDGRFAATRAAALAARGYGDEAIRHDLEQQGVGEDERTAAIDALEPELERVRAIAASSGATVKTARRLAAKGFSDEAIEAAIGELE
jgi:SOS response regulatory protein OraA/RecX